LKGWSSNYQLVSKEDNYRYWFRRVNSVSKSD